MSDSAEEKENLPTNDEEKRDTQRKAQTSDMLIDREAIVIDHVRRKGAKD